MEKLKIKVNGKINLSLDILGKLEDGYHNLDMVLSSINIYDIIEVEKRQDKKIVIKYSNGKIFKKDIAVAMANMLIQKYNCCGVNIFIDKNLPEKAGVGGSSADAAGVLYAMTVLNKIKIDSIDKNDIMNIGSDIIFMIYGGTRRVRGKGEIISTNIEHDCLNFILLCDEIGVNTAQSYANFKSKYSQVNTFNLVLGLMQNDIKLVAENINNVLFESSVDLNKNIKNNYLLLKDTKPLKVFMTGSGSGIVALYKDDETAKKAYENLQNNRKFLIKTEQKAISIL